MGFWHRHQVHGRGNRTAGASHSPLSAWLLTLAATAAAGAAAPAHADLVFRFHNQSNVEAKGIMQNVGIVWLRRGQVAEVRAKGDWSKVGTCVFGFETACNTVLAAEYTANFEHLQNAGSQYCVWKVTHKINRPANPNDWGNVQIMPVLTHQAAGYKCDVGGQLTSEWNHSAQGKGATLDFRVTHL